MRGHLPGDILALMCDTPRSTASGIAERLGECIEDVYEALVHLEARSAVRVTVEYIGKSDRRGVWEAI